MFYLEDVTNANWHYTWRSATSRVGYPTREAAERRAKAIRDLAAARGEAGPDLRVRVREETEDQVVSY